MWAVRALKGCCWDMAKGEIGWTRKTADGERVFVYVHMVGGNWKFYFRKSRNERWTRLETPPLEDWIELYHCMQKLVARKRAEPATLVKLRKRILELFPDAEI